MAKDENELVTHSNPWAHLRKHTPARIALGRSGISIPTAAHLEFQLAHARARTAVHHKLDAHRLAEDLASRWGNVVRVHSAAPDRPAYLQRPDLGRQLAPHSRVDLGKITGGPFDVCVVVSDGLSAFAIEQNIVPFLDAFLPHLDREGWTRAPLIVAEQARVALGDQIGEALGAGIVVMLIGERPGLSSPDSLGIYLTYNPKAGLTDEARNCISNVRREGLSYSEAAYKLHYLIKEARHRKLSGVNLKDEAAALPKPESGPSRNFLTNS
jgi:ethanolamine ammonia-lyase small subunit